MVHNIFRQTHMGSMIDIFDFLSVGSGKIIAFYVHMHSFLVGGLPTPLENDGVSNSWGWFSIPNWMDIQKIDVPNHQAVSMNHPFC